MLALVATAADVYAYHRSRGIDADISWRSLSDLGQQVWVHRQTYGAFGLHTQGWLLVAWSGSLFWLGRLQFELILDPDHADTDHADTSHANTAPTDGTHGTHVAADPGVVAERRAAEPTADPAGDPGPTGDDPDHPGGRGPAGDDPDHPARVALSTHIPQSGPMTPEAVDDAFSRARAFVAAHFPELRLSSFTCDSWLLDPELAAALPTSNIAAFQAPLAPHRGGAGRRRGRPVLHLPPSRPRRPRLPAADHVARARGRGAPPLRRPLDAPPGSRRPLRPGDARSRRPVPPAVGACELHPRRIATPPAQGV